MLEQPALQAQQEFLALDPAGVAAELAAGAQHAVAGHDHRHRVRAERVAGGADRARAARLPPRRRRRWTPRRSGSRRWPCSTSRVKPARCDQSIGTSKSLAAALEVLVELAPHPVERGRRLEHARRHPARQLLEHLVLAAELACTRPARAPAASPRPRSGPSGESTDAYATSSRPSLVRALRERRRVGRAASRRGLAQLLFDVGHQLNSSLEALQALVHVAARRVLARLEQHGQLVVGHAEHASGRRRRCAASPAARGRAPRAPGRPRRATARTAAPAPPPPARRRRPRARCASIDLFCAIRNSQARRLSARRRLG